MAKNPNYLINYVLLCINPCYRLNKHLTVCFAHIFSLAIEAKSPKILKLTSG